MQREFGHAARSAASHTLPAGFWADQGALRLAGDASAAIERDPRRLVAAVVAAVEGELYASTELAAELRALATTLRRLTACARGEALESIVMCSRPAEAIDLAVRTGVMSQLLPDLDRLRAMPRRQDLYKDVFVHTLRVVGATPLDLITRLAALLHDVAKPDTLVMEGAVARFPNHDLLGAERAARRLQGLCFAQQVVSGVETLVRLHLRVNSYEEDWTDSAVRRLRLDAGEHWQRLLDLSSADVTSARPEVVARARRRVQALAEHAAALDRPAEVSPLDGTALMQRFGRGPGRWIGEVKRHLIERVRDGALDAQDETAVWAEVERFLRDSAV